MWWKTNVFVVRQVCLEIAVCLISFTLGIAIAFPSILNPAILAPNAEIKVTPDQVSWIGSCLIFGGVVGFAVIPTIFQILGRKMASIMTIIFILIGNIILFIATDVYSLAFGRIAQGLAIAGTFMSALGLCECVAPKLRGYFMVLNTVSFALGSLACHSLVFILSWRQIALLATLGNLVSMILCSILPESPAFLAKWGQLDKCAETFVWYRGDSLNAKRESKEFVSAQTEILRVEEINNSNVFKRVKNMLKTKEFQKSFYILTLSSLCLNTCGIYHLLANITEIFVELMSDTSLSSYMSVATDFVLIFALGISTVFVKHFKRRTLLFSSGFCSVFVMFLISFSISLRSKADNLQDMNWLIPAVVLFHTFITNLGLVPIIFVLSGEVFSLHQKGLSSFISGIVFLFIFNVMTKLTNLLIEKFGIAGTYSTYGFFLFLFLVLLQKVLPETKDKTLQQIENEMKGKNKETNVLEIKLLDIS